MAISVNHLKVGRDRCVPVGSFVGADDVDDTYAVAGGVPEPEPGELPIMFIKLARILAIISAAPLSEPDELGGGYKIHGSSGDHKFAETLTHSHRIPTIHTARSTLIYRSLRSNWRSKRDGWKKKNQNKRHIFRQRNSLENRAKSAKKMATKTEERIFGMIVWGVAGGKRVRMRWDVLNRKPTAGTCQTKLIAVDVRPLI